MCTSVSHPNPAGILTPAPEPVAPTLPVHPPIVSAAAAIQRLRSVRIIPAREAIEQLAVWQESSRILLLYRRYFPQPFAHSTASNLMPIHHNEHGYSERELEFFTLVDQHLFPLPEMMFDEERLSSIPIYPHIVNFVAR